MQAILAHLRRSIIITVVFTVVIFVYAFVGTGVSQAFFKHQANGSITANGSTLIGQDWNSPKLFHGRPDDIGPFAASNNQSGGDNPLTANGHSGESAASNLGPRSQTLVDDTKQLIAYWHALGVNPTQDLVTGSGSGYDPDITAEDATVQIPMITKATGVPVAELQQLIKKETHGPQWGFLGSSYIVVLQLNQGLAQLEK